MEPEKKVSLCGLCTLPPICNQQPQTSCKYLVLKADAPPPPAPAPAPPVKKPRLTFWRSLGLSCLGGVLIATMVAAFLLGRFSTHPLVVSVLPAIPEPIANNPTPLEVIQQFVDAARLHKQDNLIALCHPDMIAEDAFWVSRWINEGPKYLASLQEIKLLQAEETYIATISVIKPGQTQSRKVQLKKYNGVWRVFEFHSVY